MAPDLVIHTGDLDYLHDIQASYFEPYRGLLARTCVYPCRGNHDFLETIWKEVVIPPMENPEKTGTYYSLDWGCAHFAFLDTEVDFLQMNTKDSKQLKWLDADLQAAAARSPSWTILVTHWPPLTVGQYAIYAHYFAPILAFADRYKVDLILSGHDHNYQRSLPVRSKIVHDAWQDPAYVSPQGTVCVVTGGGGGPLYLESLQSDHRFNRIFRSLYHALEMEVDPARLSIKAIAADKTVIDSFSIRKDRPRPGVPILRGDVDFNGRQELTDGIAMLGHIFFKQPVSCPPAGLIEDSDRAIQINDVILLLTWLFLDGPPPAPPYQSCEPLADEDDAWCYRARCGPP